jgi:hypothetical protein
MPRSSSAIDGFRQARPVWDRAAEMIMIAARTGKRADIAEATRQLLVCVERENWWRAADGGHDDA